MYKLLITALVVVLHVSMSTAQRQQSLVPQSMTSAELWNPFSWYYPYGIAAANAWSDYLQNAQQATNQLYQHIQAVSNPVQSTVSKLTSPAPAATTPKPNSPQGSQQSTSPPAAEETQESTPGN